MYQQKKASGEASIHIEILMSRHYGSMIAHISTMRLGPADLAMWKCMGDIMSMTSHAVALLYMWYPSFFLNSPVVAKNEETL